MADSAQKALARRAAARGYQTIWSPAPQPTGTFAVGFGGVCLFAKQPWVLRALRVPVLERWRKQGRAVIGRLFREDVQILIAVIYGFASSHPQHMLNESLLLDTLGWAGEMRCPCIVMGDVNETSSSSRIVSVPEPLGMQRLTKDDPTTTTKDGREAKGKAIDHIFINEAMKNYNMKTWTDHGYKVSDHYAVCARICMPSVAFQVWRWPKITKECLEYQVQVDWGVHQPSYSAWASRARAWIKSATGVLVSDKLTVASDIKQKHDAPPQDRRYNQLVSARRAASALMRFQGTRDAVASLRRKLRALGLSENAEPEEALALIDEQVKLHLDHLQGTAIKKWRQKVMSWGSSAAGLYSFLRNDAPKKAVALIAFGRETANPLQMSCALNQYWNTFENWPDIEAESRALDALEDRWSVWLPHLPYVTELTGFHLKEQAAFQKLSASGLDGWGLRELQLLPPQAWNNLADILNTGAGLENTLLWAYRRIPVEKKEQEVCDPANIRPLDIFSTLLRIQASAETGALKWWLGQVLHPSQYAYSRGTLASVARLTQISETILHRRARRFVLSLDFQKLFNTLSAVVIGRAMELMGLDASVVRRIQMPICKSKGVWRLGSNAVVPWVRHQRGLPQGLATSVAMAEVAVSILIHRLVRLVDCETICFVDDIHIVVDQIPKLEAAFAIVAQYTQDFSVLLSPQKTAIWGSELTECQEASERLGLVCQKTADSMGAEWDLGHKGADARPGYAKERMRFQNAKDRLARMAHLPLRHRIKGNALVAGVFSLISYVPAVDVQIVKSLRGAVRTALGQRFGAPEALFTLTHTSVLDPYFVWLICLIRLWHTMMQQRDGRELAGMLKPGRKGSRLALLVKHCQQLGWEIDGEEVRCEHESIAMRRQWSDFKKAITRNYRLLQWKLLSERRTLYHGLSQVNVKQHQKLLDSLSQYDTCVIIRVWTGAAMTLEMKSKFQDVSPQCPCGEGPQSVEHLMYHCPLHPCEDLGVLALSRQPPAYANALLCRIEWDARELTVWRRACKRVISLLQMPTVNVPQERPFEPKMHVIELEQAWNACLLYKVSHDKEECRLEVCSHSSLHQG